MSVISVQESFLNVALTAGKHITVHLLNGAKVSGSVRSFDKYSIVLESNTQEQLYLQALSFRRDGLLQEQALH